MTQRIALVTGASRGISQAIAKRLANEGYFVIGTATSEKAQRRSMITYRNWWRRSCLMCGDTEQINQLFDSIEKRIWQCTGASQQCRYYQDGLLMRMDDNAWERVLDEFDLGVSHQ